MFWGFRRDLDEIYTLLEYYETSSGNSVPTFRDNLSVPFSRAKISRFISSFYVPFSAPCPVHIKESSFFLAFVSRPGCLLGSDKAFLLFFMVLYFCPLNYCFPDRWKFMVPFHFLWVYFYLCNDIYLSEVAK